MENNTRNLFVFLIIMVTCAASLTFAGFFEGEKQVLINQGKNQVLFNITEPFYASDLIKLNPNIQVISYASGDFSVGYINFFGGVGKDFIVVDGEYEVYSLVNITMVLPNGDFE